MLTSKLCMRMQCSSYRGHTLSVLGHPANHTLNRLCNHRRRVLSLYRASRKDDGREGKDDDWTESGLDDTQLDNTGVDNKGNRSF